MGPDLGQSKAFGSSIDALQALWNHVPMMEEATRKEKIAWPQLQGQEMADLIEHIRQTLKKKPGALRNGTPFKEWDLPEPLELVRDTLTRHRDGDRQFVGILSVVPLYGIEAVSKACIAVLAANTVSRDVILNLLSRTHEDPQPVVTDPAAHLPVLTTPPVADCRRYDLLLLAGGVCATA